MANIPIRDIPTSGTPDGDAYIVFDDGAMKKGLVSDLADGVRPVASEAEAEAGSDNAKTMTALRTKQSLASEVGVSVQAHSANLDSFSGKTAPSGTVVGTTDAQTLTNKTLTAPAISSPTGLVKADVGLGNVDNTSDAAKNAASAALTNKDLSSGTNTFPTFNQNTTGSAAKLTTARNIDGQAFDGTANITVIAPGTHAATGKTTPVDADEIPLVDSAASNVLKKLTFANLKAALATFVGDSGSGGTKGVVPAPAAGDAAAGKYLKADGTWATPSGGGGLPSIANGHVVANATGSTATAGDTTLSDLLDAAFSTSVGSFLVRATGGWIASALDYANPVWWGADPTGSSDSATAINSALAASTNIVFPPGKFKVGSRITYALSGTPASVRIRGAGSNNTILYWPNSTGGLRFQYSSPAHSVHVVGLALTTGVTNGGTALRLEQTAFLQAFIHSTFDDIVFRGDDNVNGAPATYYWTNGVSVSGVSGTEWSGITGYGTGSNGTGMIFAGVGSGQESIYHNVRGFILNNMGTGVVFGTYMQGLTLTQGNIQNVVTGVYTASGALQMRDELIMSGIQIAPNSTGGNAVDLQGPIQNLIINNCVLFSSQSGAALNITAAQTYTITANNIGPTVLGSGYGMVVAGSVAGTYGVINDNLITGLGTGILLQSTAANVIIEGNSLAGNTVPLANSSTASSMNIINNLGYNPVGASAASTMGASPVTITAGPTPETHYIKQTATNTATISKNGRQIASLTNASTYYLVSLGPNESYTCTWTTTAPTYTRDVH